MVAVVGNAATMVKKAGVNTGNMMHGAAARNLLVKHINMPMRAWTEAEIEHLNEACSHIVFVAANGIRPGAPDTHPFARFQSALNQNILRTKLPVVVLGLGAQQALIAEPTTAIPKPSLDLLNTISDRAVSIAVRGENTADFLGRIGIKNTSVLGCQSCFYHMRPRFDPPIKAPVALRKIAFNYTYPGNEVPLIDTAIREGYSPFGQEEFAEAGICDGDFTLFQESPKLHNFFRQSAVGRDTYVDWIKRQFQQFYDMPSWLAAIKPYDFSFGTRFHGNMAALQSGVPALWIVHDARTKELCDYHKLPYMLLGQAKNVRSVSEFAEAADYGPFQKAYAGNYARLYDYITQAGIAHKMPEPVL